MKISAEYMTNLPSIDYRSRVDVYLRILLRIYKTLPQVMFY
jgi:hypothetical protein